LLHKRSRLSYQLVLAVFLVGFSIMIWGCGRGDEDDDRIVTSDVTSSTFTVEIINHSSSTLAGWYYVPISASEGVLQSFNPFIEAGQTVSQDIDQALVASNVYNIVIYIVQGADQAVNYAYWENVDYQSGDITITINNHCEDESSTIYLAATQQTYSTRVNSSGVSNCGGLTNLDYFPYFENSLFQYSYSDNDDITGTISLEVTVFDEQTQIVTIEVSHNIPDKSFTSPIYLKKTATGIEYSTELSDWKKVLDTDLDASDIGLILAAGGVKPSDQYGSIERKVQTSSVSTAVGTQTTLEVVVDFNSSSVSYNPYIYRSMGIEYHNKDLGLVFCTSTYTNWSGGYGYYISFTNEISLKGFKIYQLDGSIDQAGVVVANDTAPAAPTNLDADWATTSTISLTWTDNSINEQSFKIYRSVGTGGAPFELLTTVPKNTTEDNDESVSSTSVYSYKVLATNSAGNSSYSDEVLLNIFGVPKAPTVLSLLYNPAEAWMELHWTDNADDETGFILQSKTESTDWIDEAGVNISANATQATIIYNNNNDPWPTGTHYFRIRAVNSYGSSFYTNEVSQIVD